MPSEWIRDDLHEEILEAAEPSDDSFSDKIRTFAEKHDGDIMEVVDLEDLEVKLDTVISQYV